MRVLMKRAKEQSSSETKSDDLLNVTRLCELSYFPFQSYSMLAHVRERRSPNIKLSSCLRLCAAWDENWTDLKRKYGLQAV